MTAICTVSVIHQITIQSATAINESPFPEAKKEIRFILIKINSIPNNNPIFFGGCM